MNNFQAPVVPFIIPKEDPEYFKVAQRKKDAEALFSRIEREKKSS